MDNHSYKKYNCMSKMQKMANSKSCVNRYFHLRNNYNNYYVPIAFNCCESLQIIFIYKYYKYFIYIKESNNLVNTINILLINHTIFNIHIICIQLWIIQSLI